jgi:predicted transcriptional regulator
MPERSVGNTPSGARLLLIDTSESTSDVERVLKGLASDRRLAILRYLGSHSCSVQEIAEALGMPPSTAALHINVLEKAGLIITELMPASRGLQKVCALLYDHVVIALPRGDLPADNTVDVSMPIGTYVDCQVAPTCGLLGESGVIGQLDRPVTFYGPDRVHAQLLWFRHGYVEYRFPNRLPARAVPESVQVSLEICSEAVLHNDDWPSDITLWINGTEIGTWTSPADFGGLRGGLTPEWWETWNSQYGLLKAWEVRKNGTYIDGDQVSKVGLGDLAIDQAPYITVRIGIKDDAEHLGGINIFGRKFGNHPQDIVLRLVYTLPS